MMVRFHRHGKVVKLCQVILKSATFILGLSVKARKGRRKRCNEAVGR